MVAFNSLSESEQDLIPTSPMDSVVEEINVTEENKKYLFDDYDRDKVYSVTFNHTDSDKNADLTVFVDLDKETVVGKGFK
ncbi:hypothetical protein [uncultured Psychrobacillus sp.]|uniref:hypothetical protein n=1 Tax=uncultured Psychrobacillus sp. TaxID=1551585 RepID=UPI00261F62D9|nr:hypothetical protein [uncultured Psychrobacillus sp.]